MEHDLRPPKWEGEPRNNPSRAMNYYSRGTVSDSADEFFNKTRPQIFIRRFLQAPSSTTRDAIIRDKYVARGISITA